MRVVYDYQIFGAQKFGGISRYFCALASNLCSFPDATSKIIAPLYINKHLQQARKGIVSGWHLPQVSRTGRVIRAVNSRLFPLAAARFRPQIVHETYYSAQPTYNGGAAGVITVFDMIHELWPASFPVSDQTASLKRNAVRRADRVVCISENTRRDLLRMLPVDGERVFVTHLGFDRLRVGKQGSRELVGDTPYLLYVGVRNGYKNFLGFARAFAGSAWLKGNFRIVCFGGGPLAADERLVLRKLGLLDSQVIHLMGGDEDLAAVYSGAAVFIYPSLYEGFGIPPLEAMSLDCAVAASKTSSIPEVCGPAAEYFDPHDPDSISAAIERVVGSEERRKELVSLGRGQCELFTWQRCARETLAIYEGLVS